MRIFNFRYLLIAGALLAVWLMGRSRSVQPALDASWTPITGNVVSTEVPGSIAECQQNDACTDDLELAVESLDQAMPRPEISQQATIMDEPELLDESNLASELEPIDEFSVVDSSLGELASDMELSTEQVASEVEESISAATTEATEMVESQMDFEMINDTKSFEPVTQMAQADIEVKMELQSGLANVRSRDGSADKSVSPASRVGNRFVTESEEQPQSEKPSGPWTQNPFSDANVDLSVKIKEVSPVLSTPPSSTPSTPASFEQSSNSVLEVESNVQVSHPKPDLSQLNQLRSDVAPVNGTLPEGVAQEAVHHIEYGKSLSRRGASFGARQKFFRRFGRDCSRKRCADGWKRLHDGTWASDPSIARG